MQNAKQPWSQPFASTMHGQVPQWAAFAERWWKCLLRGWSFRRASPCLPVHPWIPTPARLHQAKPESTHARAGVLDKWSLPCSRKLVTLSRRHLRRPHIALHGPRCGTALI